ncbi:MAG: HAD family hydrolase [Clostridiales bacterium]|nr:HAD family hydrolase [Clostridiales bacterium]
MIKLIASDMDGTLLTTDKRLPKGFAGVVRALYEKGVSFCIASGRQYASLRRDLEALVPELIFIAENGALIMERDQQLFIDPLEACDLPDIVRAAEGLDQVYPVICRSDAALVDKSASEAFVDELRMYYEQTFVVDDLAGMSADFHDVCKVAFYDAGDAATHELPVLQQRLGDRHAVILSGANWVDVMKPGVNKGRAMQMLQTLKSLSPDECMAFGDYLNDLELLESVTESYAMENALDELRRIAKHIAPPNDEDGVMRVVKQRFAL